MIFEVCLIFKISCFCLFTMFRCVFYVVLSLFTLSVGAKVSATPNILLFMADDMGMGDCSAYLGVKLMPSSSPISQTLKTPNLESLPKTRWFLRMHMPQPRCAVQPATLCSAGGFLTAPILKTKVGFPMGRTLPMIQRASLTTLPEMLQRNGYTLR